MKKTLLCSLLACLILSSSLYGCADGDCISETSEINTDKNPSSDPADTFLSGSDENGTKSSLTEKISFDAAPKVVSHDADSVAVTDFSLRLFNSAYEGGENTLLSPLSVMYAFGLVTLGAGGETLSQIEDVLGFERDELSANLNAIRQSLKNSEHEKTALAESVWFKNFGFTANEDFLKSCSENYLAEIFTAPFDSSTKDDINSWVEDNTFGMIKNVLDEIPDDAVMYLINTLAFDCEWAEKYSEYSVSSGEFTDGDGTLRDVEFMSSEENHYLEGDNYTGFIKYYANHNYGFAALLPNDGVTVGELISSLDASELNEKLSSPDVIFAVYTKTPKFSYDYGIELSDVLKSMGMTDAFDSKLADLTGLGEADGNIYLSRVIHKTFIEVAESGTRAGAATVIEAVEECAMETPEIKYVTLDRPFLFIIFETENSTPLFIGTYEKE
ncbi:MAG: serpin family protein [Eubacteriales bacterium]